MDLGFSGGKACGGFPSCLLTGAGREPGQECEAPPTGGLLLMRFLSCAIHRLGDGKSVLSERVASSKMELFMGAWGQRPQQATWDLRASENPRFGLGGSHEALLASIIPNQNNFGITTVLAIPHDGGGGCHRRIESP